MDRKFFIEATETFTARVKSSNGKTFLSESPFIGRVFGKTDVIDEVDQDALVIFRVNVETMIHEDITEEVAHAYLVDRDSHEFGLEDERTFPLYVLNSDAWKRWNNIPVAARHVGHNAAARLERAYGASLS